MKTQRYLFLLSIICLSLLLVKCSKDGAVGPQGNTGDKGDKGASGSPGPQGPKGNANVLMYTFGSRDFSFFSNYEIKNISKGKIDSSLVLVYYNPESETEATWYASPGLGPSVRYETFFYIYQTSITPSNYTLRITLIAPDGRAYLTPVIFRKLRVIIAPASTITTTALSSFNQNNYNSVKQYYHLSD